MTDPLRIEKLRSDHVIAGFDCGREELNRFLVRFALSNQQAGAALTYVAVSGGTVVGYYSLAVGEVAYDAAPGRLSKGLARHPVPIMLLARLAVSIAWQGHGLAAGPPERCDAPHASGGRYRRIRAFAVHAKDEPARRFYEHFGFFPSPTDPLHLFLLIKDIRRVARP